MSIGIHVPPALHTEPWHPATYQVIACVLASMTLSFALGAAFSICGQWLGLLGANPLQVSVTFAIAVFAGVTTGVTTRHLNTSGRGYSPASLIGCAATLAPLALMGGARSWEVAAALLVAAGMGAGLWESSQDYLLNATNRHARTAPAFMWQRTLTQTTFTWGALTMSARLLSGDTLAEGFTSLWWALPLTGAAALVAAIGRHAPSTQTLHHDRPSTEAERLRLRLVGIVAMTMGLANFALLASRRDTGDPQLHLWLPALGSMGVTMAVLSSRWLRNVSPPTGRRTDLLVGMLGLPYAPCTFIGGTTSFVIGMVLWGVALGALHAWSAATLRGSFSALSAASIRSIAQLMLASGGLLGSVLLGAAALSGPGMATLVAITLQVTGLFCLIASHPTSSAKEPHS